jgi:hypothetical protein
VTQRALVRGKNGQTKASIEEGQLSPETKRGRREMACVLMENPQLTTTLE